MFIPNTHVTVLRRRQFAPGTENGLRVIDNRSVDEIAFNVPCWLADSLVQEPVSKDRGIVQMVAQIVALFWPTARWIPRVGDILYVLVTNQMFEIRNLAYTSVMSTFTPVRAELSTASVDYEPVPIDEITLGPGVVTIDIVLRPFGPVFGPVFG